MLVHYSNDVRRYVSLVYVWWKCTNILHACKCSLSHNFTLLCGEHTGTGGENRQNAFTLANKPIYTEISQHIHSECAGTIASQVFSHFAAVTAWKDSMIAIFKKISQKNFNNFGYCYCCYWYLCQCTITMPMCGIAKLYSQWESLRLIVAFFFSVA